MRPPSFASASHSRSQSLWSGSTKFLPPPRCARRGNSSSAAPAEPKRAIRLWKVTGPTCSVRASLCQARRSLLLSGCTRGSYARFGAAHQPADIVAMHIINQRRQDQRQHGIEILMQQQEIGRRQRDGDQRRQG